PLEEFRSCCNAVLRSDGRKVLQIGSSDGYEPLKSALIDFFRDEGLNVRSEQLLITGGCQQAIDLLCKAFLRPGDAVALENPAYPGALATFGAARIRTLAVAVDTDDAPNGRLGLNIDALESVLMQNRVKFIFATPDFHNPTGTALPMAEPRRLLDMAARYQVPVIEDYIYGRLRLRGVATASLRSLDRGGSVIQIDSVSKIAFPGLRVGWCIGPESVIERLRLVKQATDLHTDQLAQASLAEFIRRGHMARHLVKMKTVYRSRLDAMESALGKFMPEESNWTRPEGGMSVWLSLPAGCDVCAGAVFLSSESPAEYFAVGICEFGRETDYAGN